MTIEEFKTLPLWGLLPASIRKVLEAAQGEGWDLHGKGATIAFRLDRAQDDLDLPCYVQWEIGVTPKGAQSFRSGKGGVPHAALSASDVLEYLADPTTVYPLEDEPDEPETPAEPLEDAPPWDTSKTDEQNLCASLGAEVVSDKPKPRPLGVTSTTPAKGLSSATTKSAKSPEPSLADALKASLRVKAAPLRV